MAAGRNNVLTIPPGADFLEQVARAILNGHLPAGADGPPSRLELADYLLLLPTRRACRAMQSAFLRASGGAATLLPAIRPIGEGDADAGLLHGLGGTDMLGEAGGDIPPGLSELERRVQLTRLVMGWFAARRSPGADDETAPGAHATPATACHLAAELGRLMDMVETEQADLTRLGEIVPEKFSTHWQETLTFLEIVLEHWPQYLAERGLLSPAERRNRVLTAEAGRLAADPPDTPVIVAGVTGSIPATARLMRVVSELPAAAIVLPGLDLALDEESWQTLWPDHPEHPQAGLKKLLDELEVPRSEVGVLTEIGPDENAGRRAGLISEAMRPRSTTSKWHAFVETHREMAESYRAALDGVTLIEAETPAEEADVIAMIMRHAAEQPGRTAALVSPDRTLGRRVAARLEQWGLRVDDSAGRPLAKTPSGAFLDLIAEVASRRFAPAATMSLLKHPFARLGLGAGDVRRAARVLELTAFRQVYLGEGIEGIEAAFERAQRLHAENSPQHMAVRRLDEEDWAAAADLLRRLRDAFSPLLQAEAAAVPLPLQELAQRHVTVAEALAAGEDGERTPLWSGEAGDVAARFFTALMDGSIPDQPTLEPRDYPDFWRSLTGEETVRPQTAVHPRLFIWGPFEARLQSCDVMVLGGLNDGTWPTVPEPDAWLNRPMRAELGLPAPEQAVGFSAHDFTQFLGSDEVYLTRAMKVDGVPAVKSRWLMRLDALLQGLGLGDALADHPHRPWLGWARQRAAATHHTPLPAPRPAPPVEVRPRRLSVTRIEDWIANPYSIFARHILRLEPLETLGAQPDERLRGLMIHQALHRFTTAHPDALPDDTAAVLRHLAGDVLGEYAANPRIAAFWAPRFARFAQWFAETEPARRWGTAAVKSEIRGTFSIDAPAGPFELTARADRIDINRDGRLKIYDYKTGAPPENRHIVEFIAPQLPLEAAIARAGGFPGTPAAEIAGLVHIAAGGGEPPGSEHPVKADDLDKLAADALAGLERLVARYDNSQTPYTALRRPGYESRYRHDDYDHLARTDEWSLIDADD